MKHFMTFKLRQVSTGSYWIRNHPIICSEAAYLLGLKHKTEKVQVSRAPTKGSRLVRLKTQPLEPRGFYVLIKKHQFYVMEQHPTSPLYNYPEALNLEPNKFYNLYLKIL